MTTTNNNTLAPTPVSAMALADEAYDLIDRYLRNNLDDTDYEEYSTALEAVRVAPAPVGAVPVAWAATSEDGDVEALGMNQSRRFDTPLYAAPQPPAQAPDGGSIVRLVEEKIAAMSPSEVAAFMTARAALAAPKGEPAAPDITDAYAGAQEDIAIWKKRALEAEALNHRFITDINGPTFVGEPTTSDDAFIAREFYESQEDSLLICASDLQNSAIYDNHVEMQSCLRAVADRISAFAAPAQEVRQPMTNRQKNEMLKKLFYRLEGVDGDDWDWMVIDAVEAHHGITYKQGEVMTQDEMIEECIIACEALKIEYAEIAASPLVTAQGADIYWAMSAGANNCMVALRELQAQYPTGDPDAS